MDPAGNAENTHRRNDLLVLNDIITSSPFEIVARKACDFGGQAHVLDRA